MVIFKVRLLNSTTIVNYTLLEQLTHDSTLEYKTDQSYSKKMAKALTSRKKGPYPENEKFRGNHYKRRDCCYAYFILCAH